MRRFWHLLPLILILLAVCYGMARAGVTLQSLLTPAVLTAPLVFSFNNSGQCLIGYVILTVRPKFRVGDELAIVGKSGPVVRLGPLSTLLTGSEGQASWIPNSKFLTEPYDVTPKEQLCHHSPLSIPPSPSQPSTSR